MAEMPVRRSVLTGVLIAVLSWPVAGDELTKPTPDDSPISELAVCGMDEQYPPIQWLDKNANGDEVLRGLAPALLQRILVPAGWTYRYERLPAQRCLRAVQEGTEFQLLAAGSRNAERDRDFLVSDSYWLVHFHSFYSARRYFEKPPARRRADLNKLKLCGLLGHNFSAFGVPIERIDMGATTYAAVMGKLERGRCDVFPYNAEVVLGYRLLGQDLLRGGKIAHSPLIDMPPWPLHMLISRHYPKGPALLALINQELARLRASGEMAKIINEQTKQP